MIEEKVQRSIAKEEGSVCRRTFGYFIAVTLLMVWIGPVWAQSSGRGRRTPQVPGSIRMAVPAGVMEVDMVGDNIIRVDVKPEGKTSPRTPVIDPNLNMAVGSGTAVSESGDSIVMRSGEMSVSVIRSSPMTISVFDGGGRKLLEQSDPFGDASSHSGHFIHRVGENLYGMAGLNIRDNGSSLLRNNGSLVSAGSQGESGGPWFFTTSYGVLIDSEDGAFDTRDNMVQFSRNSRDDLEYFVIVGHPLKVFSGLATITGRPPLPPKWSLGFINSQWGTTEAEIKKIAATYRVKQIPLDVFIFDFDWKAWGEDNYGEWRWNSTSTSESYSADKFPNGINGKLAKDMNAESIRLAGILKPRILVYKKGSTTDMHEAAAYAEAHNLWYPGEPRMMDYVTHREARDLDFSKAETRSWYWKHLEPSFDAGIVGWWNDEADNTGTVNDGIFNFNSFQFLNMGRALYEGQREHSDLRVWSLNRNYYMGAQRYGYAEWSGDIQTGFESMERQRARMLATINMGEPHWSMDTGGFFGHPTAENYARWVEFATFVPIDRVHGGLEEKRQPWVYGPMAEAAAVQAIRLRYTLLPYIYSYEREANDTGVGLVRPLFWVFPDDSKLANEISSWMFGDALLVSPVVVSGETEHLVYLPAGTWYDYFRGTRIEGEQTINYKVDAKTWQDIPVFVRAGSILASQPQQNYVDEKPATEVTLDVFPDVHSIQFVYYDDDGETYAYEKGKDYRQTIKAQRNALGIQLQIGKAEGTFHSALQSYFVKVHGIAAKTAVMDGKDLVIMHDTTLKAEQWTTGRDRFGVYTAIRIPADRASDIAIR